MEFPAIDPVLIQIGPLVIRWYALAYLAGFLLGWAYANKLAYEVGKGRPTKEDIDNFIMWAIPGVILGGRIGYVLFYNLDYYIQNPFAPVSLFGFDFFIPSVLELWRGGMSFHGGLLGMAVAMIGYAWKHDFLVFRLSDIISCAAPFGLFFGRIANFVNAELYGRVTNSPWGVIFPGTDGQPRHPSQLYEAVLEGLVIFIVLYFLVRKNVHKTHPGVITGAFLGLYGLFRFMIEYVREPDQHIGLIFDFISMGQILCLPMIMIGIGFIIYGYIRKENDLQS